MRPSDTLAGMRDPSRPDESTEGDTPDRAAADAIEQRIREMQSPPDDRRVGRDIRVPTDLANGPKIPIRAQPVPKGLNPYDVQWVTLTIRGKRIYSGKMSQPAAAAVSSAVKLHGRKVRIKLKLKTGEVQEFRGNGQRVR